MKWVEDILVAPLKLTWSVQKFLVVRILVDHIDLWLSPWKPISVNYLKSELIPKGVTLEEDPELLVEVITLDVAII